MPWEGGGRAVGGRGDEGRMWLPWQREHGEKAWRSELPEYLGNYKWAVSGVTAEDGGEGSGG